MDKKALWDRACDLLQKEMTTVTFNTWIKTALNPLDIQRDHYFIEAVTDFYHQYVVPRYTVLISNALTQAAGRTIQAQILTPEQADAFRSGSVPADTQENASCLNDKYTFDTFVVGNNNRFAHATALAVAESPAEAYNPLFIYGGVGLGKTHLMHAIGHYMLSQKPTTRVKYVTCEAFMVEMVNALNKKSQAEFREKYRNIDVLLVDDIQFLSGKTGTQEEFFHTFNALHSAGKQIVLSSDKPPREIAKLEERLRSRFEWGLIADIGKPDLETRVAILKRKAEEEFLDIKDEVIRMIAERINNNIRELEGCLTRLVAYSSLSARPITEELASEALKEVFARSEPKHVTCRDVIDAVAEYYSLSADDLTGPRRSKDIATPRQVGMYIARELVDCPLAAIGASFGGRDHSTVKHACQKVAGDIATTPSLNNLINDLIQRLQDQ